ncbi:MAG TPA: MJ0042-type zinc finger domain-containing protein [Roseiarcus sp.]|nr:MJ0042-type zinc finger domain-containing protein [Roseiarcus sp.]
MFIVCKTCSNSYHIPNEILGEDACQFRCSGCGRSWELQPRATLAAPVASTRGDPARRDRAPAPGPTLAPRLARLARKLAAPLAAAGLLAGSMTAIGARETIVAAAPIAAGAYAAIGLPVNLRGLAIEDVRARLGGSGDEKILMVEGAIVNLREAEIAPPALRIALRAADGRELYVWTTRAPKDRLARGERVRFAARLATPPGGIADALVKFVAPGDKIAPNPEGS